MNLFIVSAFCVVSQLILLLYLCGVFSRKCRPVDIAFYMTREKMEVVRRMLETLTNSSYLASKEFPNSTYLASKEFPIRQMECLFSTTHISDKTIAVLASEPPDALIHICTEALYEIPHALHDRSEQFIWVIDNDKDEIPPVRSDGITVFRSKLSVKALKMLLENHVVPRLHAKNVYTREFQTVQ